MVQHICVLKGLYLLRVLSLVPVQRLSFSSRKQQQHVRAAGAENKAFGG